MGSIRIRGGLRFRFRFRFQFRFRFRERQRIAAAGRLLPPEPMVSLQGLLKRLTEVKRE
jgi:hypothetical protein